MVPTGGHSSVVARALVDMSVLKNYVYNTLCLTLGISTSLSETVYMYVL